MKVEFYCNSGANIHSCRKEVVDLDKWGITDEEWKAMSHDEKNKMAEEWAWERGLDIGYREVEK